MTCERPYRYAKWGYVVVLVMAAGVDAARIQFGVAELPATVEPHGDSFVVTIDESDPQLLAHARALVNWIAAGGQLMNSPGQTILVADIAAGADHINRNYLAEGEPAWSWHITGTPSFADWTIEILDGWPTFVESDIDGWIANTGGAIGFWGYTIVTEIGPLLPGDFDRDSDVDGVDFLIWQRGASPTLLSPSDLADWEMNHGSVGGGPIDFATAPEPATFYLLVASAVVMRCGRVREAASR